MIRCKHVLKDNGGDERYRFPMYKVIGEVVFSELEEKGTFIKIKGSDVRYILPMLCRIDVGEKIRMHFEHSYGHQGYQHVDSFEILFDDEIRVKFRLRGLRNYFVDYNDMELRKLKLKKLNAKIS